MCFFFFMGILTSALAILQNLLYALLLTKMTDAVWVSGWHDQWHPGVWLIWKVTR